MSSSPLAASAARRTAVKSVAAPQRGLARPVPAAVVAAPQTADAAAQRRRAGQGGPGVQEGRGAGEVRDRRDGREGASARRSLAKGQQTKAALVEAALNLATHIGLEGLSIGAIAELTGMSKSGVFAHFGSREELQISVVQEYHARFEQEVFYPALQAPRGIARLRALFAQWMKRSTLEIDSGCIYISGAVEFDERAGPVRDALVESVKTWHAAMRRTIEQCVECGDLRAGTDPEQLLFEIHGLILALHYEARFLRSETSMQRAQAGFHNIVASYATSPLDA